MSDLNEKIKNLKKQQEQAREIFIKCQGGIEVIEGLLEDEKSSKENKKDKK